MWCSTSESIIVIMIEMGWIRMGQADRSVLKLKRFVFYACIFLNQFEDAYDDYSN